MTQISGWLFFGTEVAPKPAHALQERNEQLCKTGFFTNIAQYYCTDIGNISDEGVSKGPSVEETGKMESLMSKFDLGEAADGSSNNADDYSSEKVATNGESYISSGNEMKK